MAKINFKKPHFILPLIILPFFFVFYYIFYGTGEEDTGIEKKAEVAQEGFNTDLPNPSDQIVTPDRLEAYKEAVRKRRLETGMGDIEGKETRKRLQDEESISTKDSLKQLFADAKVRKAKQDRAAQNREKAIAKAADTRRALMNLRQKNQNSSNLSSGAKMTSSKSPAALSKKDRELEAFKKQMNYLDSLQNPEKYIKIEPEVEKETEKSFNISRTNQSGTSSSDGYFNTIKADLKQTLISAILDEGIKAWQGSRVRIRLLEPIFIDGRLLDKGQYLYGICTGFKAQRLLIEVSSVVINDEIFPLNVSLFDNDGIEGIYIPDSSFRTFTKELGSRSSPSNIQLDRAPNNNSQALYQSLSKAIQSSSRSVQKALRKNKATLKYNTQVYLVNKNKNKKQ